MTTDTARTRLSPQQRRAQLLEVGVAMLATRSIDQLSIDAIAGQAGISRGLLYHYFGGKHGFYQALVQHAADQLFRRTAPPAEGQPLERLLASMTAYVDYVAANQAGYRSLVQGAAGGNEALRGVYDATFTAMGERFFAEDPTGRLLPDTPATRLAVRSWQAMVEALVLAWCEDDAPALSRDQLLRFITDSLPALLAALPE